MRHFLEKAPHSIVILRALQLGDLLCAVPAFRALRKAFPDAKITLVGLTWARNFVPRFSAYLDDFIEFPGWPGLPEQEARIEQIPDFLHTVQSRRFDLALQMQGSGGLTNPITALFGAKKTAGFYSPGDYQPDQNYFPVYPHGEHEIRVFLKLLETLGIPSQGEQLEFPVSADERQTFNHFLAENGLEPGRYICLHPGARFTGRRWSTENFAAVGDELARQGFQVIVTGTREESELTRAVTQQMQFPAIDAAGRTDLGTLALLIEHARLLVSNDTGVSHIAAAFQTPSLILFTVSDPGRWQPLNHLLHRAVVNADRVSPQAVLMEAAQLLEEEQPRARRYADKSI